MCFIVESMMIPRFEYVMEQTLYSSQSWIGPPVAPIKAQRMYYAYLH